MRRAPLFDAICKCGWGMYLVNTSWIECTNPNCPFPEGSIK